MRDPRSFKSSRRAIVLMLPMLLALPLLGCGYTLRAPFRDDIKTVYVPVFHSQSFRRDLNFQLTRMVQDEIRRRTPFRVVGTPEEADSTLSGTITFVDKNAMVESPNNLPRQIQGTIMATVKWTDNRLSFEKKRDLQPVPVVESTPFYPELGETAQLGYLKGMEKLARQVVDMMEEPW
ncbi:MAG: LptE family protein [Isosphaeraceae bacterium]